MHLNTLEVSLKNFKLMNCVEDFPKSAEIDSYTIV